MKPVWTEIIWPPTTPIVSLADARDWIGVYGDTSIDAEVQAALDAAVEKVADNVGFRISDSGIIDFYPRAGGALELSEPGLDVTTVKVRYYDADRELQTLDSDQWVFDPTTAVHTIELADPAKVVGLMSTKLRNPLQVAYTSKLATTKGTPSVGRLRLAVRTALNWYWGIRGSGARNSDTFLLDRTLTSMLMSVRRDPIGSGS